MSREKDVSSGRGLLGVTLQAIRRYGIKPTRRLGQCYVVDPRMVSCILQAAEVGADESVLEIGAGTGNLTEKLALVAKRVIAVEKDAKAAMVLRDRFCSAGNVEVVNCDILSMDLPRVDKVVSNLPYSISTPITFKLLFRGDFKSATLTYQREVAERLYAKPGGRQYSRLSVAVALLAEVEEVGNFSPESFYPRPKVESTVILMRRKASAGIDWEVLDSALKVLFSQRRRKLRRALETYSKVTGADLGGLVASLGGELDRRVYELQPEEFVRISERLEALEPSGCAQVWEKRG